MKSSFLKILYRSGGASRCLKVSALPRITSISQTDLRRYFVGVADHAEAPPRSLSSESQDAQEDYYDDSNFSDNANIDLHKSGVGTGKNARLSVDLDPKAEKYLTENDLKPRKHPGVFYLPRQELPEKFVTAAERILSHENLPALYQRSQELNNYLWSRKLPVNEHEYKEKVTQVESKLLFQDDILRPFLSQQDLSKLDHARENKTRHRLKELIYHWEPINYTRSKGLEYLLGRSAAEYASLYRIFNEIVTRDSSFTPKSLCDFGSGVGTVVWASKAAWKKPINEYMCVDTSREMNDLSELLLRGGNTNNDHGINGLFHRQFLPQSSRTLYDIVVSSYSLMELPSFKARLQVIDILWKKTKDYLVIVESGTNAGFKAVIEARDYILQLDKPNPNKYAHVFSPCSSSTFCPRFTLDNVPCNFRVKHKVLYPYHEDKTRSEIFSYVVIKKGKKNSEDETWPRLIHDPIIRKRHVICRVCTKEGKLSEVLLTKTKHSQSLYRVARKSHGGDLLPVKEIANAEVTNENASELSEDDSDDKSIVT